MQVTLYSFSKKTNSTRLPSGGAGFNCRLKDSSSVIEPVLEFQTINNPSSYNYVYIPAFSRYYFISNWTYYGGVWTCNAVVDVLASWKSNITSYTCYILRASNKKLSNEFLTDGTYPIENSSIVETTQNPTLWASNYDDGVFSVGVAGTETTYYLMNRTNLNKMFTTMFSDDYADSLLQNWGNLYPQLRASFNPLQYITSLNWLPFKFGSMSVQPIKVGWVDLLEISNAPISATAVYHTTTSFPNNKHPDAEERGRYLNCPPFSSYWLLIPPFGEIALDGGVVGTSQLDITCDIWVDLKTGSGTLKVTCGANYLLGWYHAQVGIPHQASQIYNNEVSNLDLALTGASAALSMFPSVGDSGNGNIGGILGGVNQINSGLTQIGASNVPHARTIGGTGSVNSLIGKPTLYRQFWSIADEDFQNRGRLICSRQRIGSFSGFVLCSNASLSLPATDREIQSVNSFLNGGFFVE